MPPRNDYYSETLNELYGGKDSIIELAKVLAYDSEKQVARVYTVTSRQYKDDVPVYFASLYQNTGVISPPVIGSTSLLLWGRDRQPFLLPVQITTPAVEVKEGVTSWNASPSLIDALYSLKNIQGGEHLIRSLGGAYVFLKNIGDVEIGTASLHRLAVTEKDGAFDLQVERIRSDTGNSRFYLGPASMDSDADLRTHCYFELEEYADEPAKLQATGEDLVNMILSDQTDQVEMEDADKIYVSQKAHVFDSTGSIIKDDVDGTELFSQEVFQKDGIIYHQQLSKGGRKFIVAATAGREVQIAITPQDIEITQNRSGSGVYGTTSVRIDEAGRIMCEKDGKEFDLFPMLEWFYEQRV